MKSKHFYPFRFLWESTIYQEKECTGHLIQNSKTNLSVNTFQSQNLSKYTIFYTQQTPTKNLIKQIRDIILYKNQNQCFRKLDKTALNIQIDVKILLWMSRCVHSKEDTSQYSTCHKSLLGLASKYLHCVILYPDIFIILNSMQEKNMKI